jgi:transposase
VPDPKQSRDRAGRRAKRFLTPAEKYQAFVQVLSGEMTVAQCAEHWGVDRSTIMKAREVAKQGALTALASSRPGVRADGVDPELMAARHEIARLSEALKEMAVKVTLLEGKQRWG